MPSIFYVSYVANLPGHKVWRFNADREVHLEEEERVSSGSWPWPKKIATTWESTSCAEVSLEVLEQGSSS